MSVMSPAQAAGDIVTLARTDPRHFVGAGEAAAPKNTEQAFGDLLFNALGSVNNSQKTATDLVNQMITAPDSVNVSDVMIAAAEANLALSMTKAIVDRALTAYRDIINVR